jgi:hypothetical protein
MSRGGHAGASGAPGGWSVTGGGPGLVSRILRVELTMGYKEEEGAPMERTDYFPPTYFLSTTYWTSLPERRSIHDG